MPRASFFVVATLALLSQLVDATNKYPVILVHGFGGWGRDELLGFKYWGGNNNDYQERLQRQGFEVYTATIGPFSSNWDRACELYAQIKGGRVDYGPNHAKVGGHQRYGRTYTGLYPQWGTVVNGKIQKVHLVGHSMGGQTIRVLTQLLNQGTTGAPITEVGSSHPLFTGGKDWVHSVTTVSTPNQGTTLADGMGTMMEKIEAALVSWFGLGGLIPDGQSTLYDAKLEHWGVTPRQKGESIRSYVHRIFTSSFFSTANRDNSRYELTTAGARALNTWVRTQTNVYYYGISTKDTFSMVNFQLKRIALPNPLTMLIPLQPCATYMGSRTTVDAGFPESWLQNDGQVNVPSQLSDGTGKTVPWANKSVRGAWNVFATKDHVDHFAITGNSIYYDTLDTFSAQIRLLLSLPSQEELGKRRLREGELDAHDAPADIAKEIDQVHRKLIANARQAVVRQCQSTVGSVNVTTAAFCEHVLNSVAAEPSFGVLLGV